MEWIDYSQVSEIDTVDDFQDLLDVFNNPSLTEFQYLVEGDNWKVSKR